MPDKHLSSQFDSDLNSLCSKLLEMGGMVESQISNAMHAFTEMDLESCNQVIEREKTVNDFEIDVDLACTEIIARRQPTARDLRLVMAESGQVTRLKVLLNELSALLRQRIIPVLMLPRLSFLGRWQFLCCGEALMLLLA